MDFLSLKFVKAFNLWLIFFKKIDTLVANDLSYFKIIPHV
ncbi:hypothetical protein FLACHUCJ7_02507 [Flavobacterium chungangense]|uniref:Uncharacterized protein n=1 Tax=Flavobacterium chungangense TaxID=554283 RepID=A0A6V6Z1R1_9FLAO|nr:hypothetical protein FLACHUCJ7_02507 [Flavobacterium chungangense]